MELIIMPLSAGISGIIETSLTHPIDSIKTKIQEISLDKNFKHKCSSLEAIKIIYSQNKLSGFYSGITPKIIGIIPMRMIYWSTMAKMNKITKNQSGFFKYIVPGFVAGFVQTFVDTPIETIKIKLMTSNNDKNIYSQLFKFENIKKIYSGFCPNVIRNCIFAIVVASSVKVYGQNDDKHNKYNKFFVGAMGGFVGSFLSQPFDVIKTELQRCKNNDNTLQTIQNIKTTNKSMFKIFMTILKTNPCHLWSGGTMRCTLAFFNMGIGFYSFQIINTKLENILL